MSEVDCAHSAVRPRRNAPLGDTSAVTSPADTTVVIATYRRPDHVRRCLEHLARQTARPREIVVVDASEDRRTHAVVADWPEVRYLRNDAGAGTLATSRAIAFAETDGDVIAYLDDDAFARPDWLESIVRPYADPTVAAVGGRALNGQPGEDAEGVDRIGRIMPDGRLTGFFAADPGRDLDVDHMLGANMSYRRSVADQLGGVHDFYPGTCLREDADMPLRMRRAGHRVVYTPAAVVEHEPGPYARGRRFDLRYTYYSQRNHLVLLSRTFGVGSRYFRRYVVAALGEVVRELGRAGSAAVDTERGGLRGRTRGAGGSVLRAFTMVGGLLAGGAEVVRLRRLHGPV